jgi:hypothetical protein
MLLDQIKVADLHAAARLLQCYPDLCILLCGLFAGRGLLIRRQLPIERLDVLAKQFLAVGQEKSLLFSQEYRQNSKEFRRSLEIIWKKSIRN